MITKKVLQIFRHDDEIISGIFRFTKEALLFGENRWEQPVTMIYLDGYYYYKDTVYSSLAIYLNIEGTMFRIDKNKLELVKDEKIEQLFNL